MKRGLTLCAVALLFAGTAFAADTAVKGEFGNHDAQALTTGKQVMTDCKINWQDTATKKTYCFSSEQMKTEFAKDTKGNVAKAETEFKKVMASKEGAPAGAVH